MRAVGAANVAVIAFPLGMKVPLEMAFEQDLPFVPERRRPEQIAALFVYHPQETAWLRRDHTAEVLTVDGFGMLVHQAPLQQQIWRSANARVNTAAIRAAATLIIANRASGFCSAKEFGSAGRR